MTTRWLLCLRCRPKRRVSVAACLAGLCALACAYFMGWGPFSPCLPGLSITEQLRDANDSVVYSVTTNHPFIFIGGMPRSGTTLMRTILDAHSAVRCGVETRVVPRLLQMLARWETEKSEHRRLQAAGILGQPLEAATAAFIMQILMRNGPPSRRLCGKDPYSMVHARRLGRLFPSAKFILMLRDGRAFVHSAITRKIQITGFDLNRPLDCLAKWNAQVSVMYNQCQELGSRCLAVRYEDLVLDPPQWIGRVSSFLGLAMEQSMLSPWLEVGRQVRLSDTERSSDQVRRPFYLASLTAWTRGMTPEFALAAPRVAPMLEGLGYDTERLPPRYGAPNPAYWRNTTYYK